MGLPRFAKPKARNESSSNLYVANCGPAVGLDLDIVKSAFSKFGVVSGVYSADESGTRVIVSFVDISCARAAFEALDRRACEELGARVLHIKYSVFQPPVDNKVQVNDSVPVCLETSDMNIPGICLIHDFITIEQEKELLAAVDSRPWKSLAKRRVQHYGYEFCYSTRNVNTNQYLGELPLFLSPVLDRISSFEELSNTLETSLDQLTVNEYPPGVGLSPHIDTHSAFEGSIFSLSLAGPCIMEFRKYTDIDWISKSTSLDKEVENSDSSSSFLRRAIYLPPRSILLLSGEARYAWHHYIPHHKEQSRRKLVTRIEYEKFLQITSRVMVKEPQNMHSGDIQPTGNISKFPRSNVWDPYKRLGITTDASEEEVWSSRNFLLDQYAGHERSVESIEAAFEKILMTSFLNRKKTKINLKSRLKKQVEESPPWVKNLISFIELPPNVIIVRRLFLFAFMACWSVNSSAEGGPAFQWG